MRGPPRQILVRCIVCGTDEHMISFGSRYDNPIGWVTIVAAYWPPGCFEPEQGPRSLRVCGKCLRQALNTGTAERRDPR